MTKLRFQFGVTQRLVGSVLLFSLPLGVLVYYNLDQIAEKIAFAELERSGGRFQRPYIAILKGLNEHQLLAMRCGRGPSAQNACASSGLAAKAQEIDGHFQKLEALERELGASLHFVAGDLKAVGLDNLRSSALTAKWEEIKGMPPGAKDRGSRYDALVSDLRTAISHAGDTSNLTLDPELDTYSLGDVTSVTSAQILNRIASAAQVVESAAGRPLSKDERTQVAIYAAALKESDFDRTTGDIDSAFKANLISPRGIDPTLKSNVEEPLNKYMSAIQGILHGLSEASKGKAVDMNAFGKATAQASDASFALLEKAGAELDVILRMRVAKFQAYRFRLVAGTSVALALAITAFTVVLLGITRPLKTAVEALDQIALGRSFAGVAGRVPQPRG